MSRSLLAAAALAGAMAAAMSAMAQHPPANTGQVAALQRALSSKGFSPGRIDGLWGPDTAAALKRFQAATRLGATGDMDPATLQALGVAQPGSPVAIVPNPAPMLSAGPPPAVAQNAASPGTPPGAGSAPPTPLPPAGGPSTSGSTAPGTNAGVNAASGNNNQAVATTNANAPQPAHGANSFTIGEARRRLAREGFQNVSALRKDNDGVWRGTAARNGQQVGVWLDYKGNIGQQ